MNTIRRGRAQVRPCDRVRPEDAAIVSRLVGAGAILLGKHPACPRRRLTAATLVVRGHPSAPIARCYRELHDVVEVALLTPLPGPMTTLERLVASRRATGPVGDLLMLGPPLGKRPSRRASDALDELRQNER